MKKICQALLAIPFVFLAEAASAAAEKEPPLQFDACDRLEQKVADAYCAPNSFYRVIVLRDEKGQIGAYVLRPAIMDSPIPYLDCHGAPIATFHIFGSDEEKAKATSVINALQRKFPRQEALDCHSLPGRE